MLNLAKYEQDDDVHIDICADKNGNLSTATAFRYVAQIEIPARQYREVETENPDYNPENGLLWQTQDTKEVGLRPE